MESSRCVALLCCVLAGVAACAGDTRPTVITRTFASNDGTIGVASVAGITSRNGRVSSVSGVKFYPSGASNKDVFGNKHIFTASAKSGDKLPAPITFSKEENGKYTAGTINIGPGSVSVSSIARSVPEGSQGKIKPPLIDDMFFAPLNLNSRSLNPWFPNNIPFGQPSPFRMNTFRPSFPYHNFGPFYNYWQ